MATLFFQKFPNVRFPLWNILIRPSGGVTWGVGLLTGFIGHVQFLITVHSGPIPNSHIIKFTTHALSLPSLLSLTSPMVPGSNGGCSLSWFPELYPHHSLSSSWLTVHSLELFWNCLHLSLVMSFSNISSDYYLPYIVTPCNGCLAWQQVLSAI
jgi:hypothetical protein